MNLLDASGFVVYGLLWLSFGAVHSLLARAPVQTRLKPLLGSGYRLAYNIFALLHFALVIGVGRYCLSSEPFALLSGTVASFLLNSIFLVGLLVILLALRQYDLGLFSGLTQWRRKPSTVDALPHEPLNTQGLNRWVRHPLYSGAFLMLWGHATSPFGLATAFLASLYILIGARYEERQLVSLYGDAYRRYQADVPAYVPAIRPRH